VPPDCMARAFASLGAQDVAQELLLQFSLHIAGDDGLIGIHDMFVDAAAGSVAYG
jgi:hypothetical protein